MSLIKKMKNILQNIKIAEEVTRPQSPEMDALLQTELHLRNFYANAPAYLRAFGPMHSNPPTVINDELSKDPYPQRLPKLHILKGSNIGLKSEKYDQLKTLNELDPEKRKQVLKTSRRIMSSQF